MKQIKAKPITVENFHTYGSFTDIANPEGLNFDGFYRDQAVMNTSGQMQVAFSPLTVHKELPRIVKTAEYHNTTQEGVLCIDDDVILHVAPASKEPVPELTEAFIVPKGTLVVLNTAVWHLSAMPVNLDTAHVLIILPERTYFNDCTVVNYPADSQVEIVMD